MLLLPPNSNINHLSHNKRFYMIVCTMTSFYPENNLQVTSITLQLTFALRVNYLIPLYTVVFAETKD